MYNDALGNKIMMAEEENVLCEKIPKNLFKFTKIQIIPKKYENPKNSEKSFSIQKIQKSLKKSFWDFQSKESQIRCYPLAFYPGKILQNIRGDHYVVR